MSRIGIMGGTFNPIHLAHLAMAEAAWKQAHLDEIWFMPSKNPPHKVSSDVLSETHRKRMTQLAIQGHHAFVFSDYELMRRGTTYTADTLYYLGQDYPEHTFFFIMGGDSFYYLENWHEPAKIMASCELLVFSRDDLSPEDMEEHARYLEETYQAKIRLLQLKKMEISSSRIRTLFRQGKGREAGKMLPEQVKEYIIKHHLYVDTEIEGE